MKILYYNWCDFDNIENHGGGVKVYQKNLIDSLSKNEKYDIYTLSGGLKYSLVNKQPFVKLHKYENNVRMYHLYNSFVVSSGHLSFYNNFSIAEESTTSAVKDFLLKEGPFDVIQFDNLEGIPLSIVTLKKDFPKTKFIFSIHNYYSICPQVNLWFKEKETCTDNKNGLKCIDCLTYIPNPVNAKRIYTIRTFLNDTLKIKYKSKLYEILLKILKNLIPNKPYDLFSDFTNYKFVTEYLISRRNEFISVLNDNIDQFLAVSKRVEEIVTFYGFSPKKVSTLYIGTKVAEEFSRENIKIDFNGNILTITYLGYMRKDKGFEFFLDTLENMPISMSSKMRVIVAANNINNFLLFKLKNLGLKFYDFIYLDGYKHSDLNNLYLKTDLTIIPVLWEDNLPQVAIESICHGVPIFCSDLGGTKELGNNPKFVFKNGNVDDYIFKLNEILNRKTLLSEFWEKSIVPMTMEKHIEELMKIYKN